MKFSRLPSMLLLVLFALTLSHAGAAEVKPLPPPANVSADMHIGKPILVNNVPAPIPRATDDTHPTFDFDSGHVALALASVIGLILLLRYVGKTLFPDMIAAGRGHAVRVLARCPLAPRQQVILIQIGRRIVVAGDCGSQLSALCQITDPDEVAALLGEIQREKSAPITTPFTSWFKTAAEAFTGADDAEPTAALPRGENVDLLFPDDSPRAARLELDGLSEKIRDLTRQLG